MSAAMSPHIAFEGIDNFRDFGGYRATRGELKRGVFFRSAHQARATDADLAKLADLGLSLIVDLRRANERERDPSRRWPGFTAAVIENSMDQNGADEWLTFIAESDLTADSFRAYMLDYYTHAPFQARHIDLYSRYFRSLAETDGAILVHCTAGKDRTGILCALTHHVAGVHDDDVVADYLLTNDPARLAARLPVVREAIREATGRDAPDAALMTAMRVEAEYLERAFGVMREAHGSLDGYLENVLGLDGRLRERLHERLLA